MIYRLIASALVLLIHAQAQNRNCDYSQNVQAGRTYSIYNPNYPNKYQAGVQCRWIATCPSGYNCKLNCQLNIPQSSGCKMDRVLISKTGDSQMTSAETYCGTGRLTAVSTKQKISVGLISTYYSTGGTFTCSLAAQRVVNPKPECTCGLRKMRRIVGGQDTKPNEFPMMAGLVEYKGQATIICGGVIIARNYVLTAAHCLLNRNFNALAVVVGEHDISTGADSPGTKAYRVTKVRAHPNFNDQTYDYDVAILTTTLMEFNDYVSAACLPFKFSNYDFSNQKVIILGWGTLFIGGPRPNVLQQVEVNVISQTSCRQSVRTVTLRQICTFTPGKDACQYDSGGPLLYTDPQTGLLFHTGIVSFGQSCASADQPGVNTRITEILNWIVRFAPADYCVK